MNLKKQIAARLRSIRQTRGLSQEDVALMVDRSVDAISNIERGKNLPNLETLVKLCIELHLNLADLVGDLGNKARSSAKRSGLESELAEIARKLPDDQLAIAVKQLRALLPEKDG